jgi:hypothetical protein
VYLRGIGWLAGRHRWQASSYRKAKSKKQNAKSKKQKRRTPMLFTTHQAER